VLSNLHMKSISDASEDLRMTNRQILKSVFRILVVSIKKIEIIICMNSI